MDFTPKDMEAVQSCLEGIDRNVPVAVERAAAKLLMPNTVRTVADLLNLPTWPSEQLRLVVERWQPAAEVVDRADTLKAFPSVRKALPVAAGIFWAAAEGVRPRYRIRLRPDALMRWTQ